MRCLAAIYTCLALLLAFVVAPFEHVHTGDSDHDHHGTIHAHFYNVGHPAVVAEENHGPEFESPDDDDHAKAWSLDTFTLVLTAGLSPFIPLRGAIVPFVLSETSEPVLVVEERGHDPPPAGPSIPRAPPA